jgi:2-polyprenyl-3-methyl-5-hydroxy-6-metoxy-1,4-benzoquinol methylase
MRAAEFKSMFRADERHWWYRGRRLVVLREIERLELGPGAQLLDAGCGSGRMLDELSRYGHAHGVDSNAWAVSSARARGHADVRLGMVEQLPYATGTFDLVTCLDVIEHTPDDHRVLAELRRVTAPGGHLLVTVPAYQFLWSAHDEANDHYRRYRRRTLRDAALACRWEVERDTYFNSILLPPAALVRIARKRRIGHEGRSELAFTPTWLDPVLLIPLRLESAFLRVGGRLPAGLSLLALLRKPAVIPTAGAVVVGPGAPDRRAREPAPVR